MKDSDKRIILKLARESIKTYFSREKPKMEEAKHLSDKRGVFVTLHDKRNQLRGCVGFPMPSHPLNLAIVEAARSAAFQDSRFHPVEKDEFDSITIEVSVLTKPELVKISHYNDYLKQLKIGEDGLIVEGSYGSGLLLPQVATENNFNIQGFLNCVCQKAGMSFNCWKDPDNKIYKFQAEIFSEKEFPIKK